MRIAEYMIFSFFFLRKEASFGVHKSSTMCIICYHRYPSNRYLSLKILISELADKMELT